MQDTLCSKIDEGAQPEPNWSPTGAQAGATLESKLNLRKGPRSILKKFEVYDVMHVFKITA